MAEQKRIVFRCDASVQIGSGHVMRCLTLANGLREQGTEITFICREHPGHLFAMIESAGHGLIRLSASTTVTAGKLVHAHWLGATQAEDAEQALAALGEIAQPDWIIVDHYALDAEWEIAMRSATRQIMVIDDLADRMHDCDVLLDQNLHSGDANARYENLVPPRAKKLMGPKYAMLRPEFLDARQKLRERDGIVKRVFIFYGGSDPSNETGKALRALQQFGSKELAVDVVVGGNNTHLTELAALCAELKDARLHRQVNNMAELMSSADVAIGAGGGTMWERCCLGLPAIVTSIAANQEEGCEAVAMQGGIIYLGGNKSADVPALLAALQVLKHSPCMLQNLKTNALKLADGQGVKRVVRELVRDTLELRLANEADCEPAFQWRNHENTRKYFFNPAPIAWEEHCNWFDRKLKDVECVLLVGLLNNDPIGILRYDLAQPVAVVSIYLLPDKHGIGLGALLLLQGEQWIRSNHPGISELKAEVLSANGASMRTFIKVGFESHTVSLSKLLH